MFLHHAADCATIVKRLLLSRLQSRNLSMYMILDINENNRKPSNDGLRLFHLFRTGSAPGGSFRFPIRWSPLPAAVFCDYSACARSRFSRRNSPSRFFRVIYSTRTPGTPRTACKNGSFRFFTAASTGWSPFRAASTASWNRWASRSKKPSSSISSRPGPSSSRGPQSSKAGVQRTLRRLSHRPIRFSGPYCRRASGQAAG